MVLKREDDDGYGGDGIGVEFESYGFGVIIVRSVGYFFVCDCCGGVCEWN